MAYRDLEHELCSIARPVALLGDRWTFIILRQAFRGIRRFDEFQSTLGISRSLLAGRLATLTEAGVFERHAYADEHRTRYEYRLTEQGMDLYPVLMALRAYADKHMSPDGPLITYRHRDCGGFAEIHHTCAECGKELSAREVVAQPGPGTLAARASGAAG